MGVAKSMAAAGRFAAKNPWGGMIRGTTAVLRLTFPEAAGAASGFLFVAPLVRYLAL